MTENVPLRDRLTWTVPELEAMCGYDEDELAVDDHGDTATAHLPGGAAVTFHRWEDGTLRVWANHVQTAILRLDNS